MHAQIIWMYWQQGWTEAPVLVRQCRDSWERLNPGYEVRALDRNTLLDHLSFPKEITFDRPDLPVQKVAALARLELLRRHGGVWTDATVMCATPLDRWIAPYLDGGFFCFRNPGIDRLASNWFIAARQDSLILQRLHQSFLDFFVENTFANQCTPYGRELIAQYSARWCKDVPSSLNWHSWHARRVLQVYPYYIFHYTFNQLILTDPECEALWSRSPALPADPPHVLQQLQREPNGLERAIRQVDAGVAPMYKLDWRVDAGSHFWSGVLERFGRLP